MFTTIALLLLPQILFGSSTNSIAVYPRSYNERFAIQALVQIHGAQMTYWATYGNGNYASTLEALRQFGRIDAALASGSKYGYIFAMSATPNSPQTPASFFVTATPQRYPKTGRRSFYINASRVLRGGDKNGEIATTSDPEIEIVCGAGNENCAIQALRTLHGAEFTYAATSGSGNFGTLTQLADAFLISGNLGSGTSSGYRFVVTTINQSPSTPANFTISAFPLTYGVSGIRSFFIATDGVIRGADKNGLPADENDPPINQ